MDDRNAKQLIKLDPRVSGGTFTLSGAGVTTAAIPANAPALHLQALLTPVFGADNVLVTGTPKSWLVEFTGVMGAKAQPLLTADNLNLVGSVKTITISEVAAGTTAGDDPPAPAPEPQATEPPAADPPAPLTQAPSIVDTLPHFATGSGKVDRKPMPLGHGPIRKSLVIRANGSNTGVICIGNTPEDSAEGYILGKGETTTPICVDNLNKVYLVGSANAQGFSWIAT